MNFKVRNSKKFGTGSSIDLTPVVDIVFNLLIFFALSLNFAAASRGIDIRLPSSSTAETIRSDQVTINITKEGEIYLDDKPININQLGKSLKEKTHNKSLVIIRADTSVEHGRVVTVMDIIKSQGLNRIAIAVDDKADNSIPQ